ncbi:MAG: hypothetical protein OXI66_00830, partial [Boseongicola sp.]|nr:hypothetical protein [Boseongicola sp.]
MKPKSDRMPSKFAAQDESNSRTGMRGSARLSYHIKVGWKEPTAIIGALMVVLFAYLVIVPIVTLLHDAAEVQFGDARRAKAEVGAWTLYY